MGAELYAASPLFAEGLERACGAFDPHLERSLLELILDEQDSELDRTEYTQPALFALELALAGLLGALGLRPELCAGPSVGELCAAHLAGVLSLEDAARLIAARGALMGALPEGGAMLALQASEAEATEAIEGAGAELSLAAVNGPTSVVLSGAEAPLMEIAARFAEQGRRTRRLAVSHAFHSPLIE